MQAFVQGRPEPSYSNVHHSYQTLNCGAPAFNPCWTSRIRHKRAELKAASVGTFYSVNRGRILVPDLGGCYGGG